MIAKEDIATVLADDVRRGNLAAAPFFFGAIHAAERLGHEVKIRTVTTPSKFPDAGDPPTFVHSLVAYVEREEKMG